MKRAFVLAALVACSPPDRGPRWKPAGNAAPRDGGTLHFATTGGVRTLDPTIQYDEYSSVAVHALFDTLVAYEPGGITLRPHLAESWTVSADGLDYQFALRAGLVYSDGSPVVAGDLVYSLQRALTTADSPFASFLSDVAPGGISAPTDRELAIRLVRRNAAFIYVMTMPFTTPQRAAHVTTAGEQLRRSPLGTGPFVLERWDEGERIVLRKNPHYWDRGNVHLDVLDWLENIPRDTQFLMFERGDLDSVDHLASPDYLWLAEQRDWEPYIHRVAVMSAYGSRMNVRNKPFDDRRVRQALNYALDKGHTIKLLNGDGIPSHGLLPPGMLGRDEALAPYPHDPAKARALLAEAGYSAGFDVDYVTFNDDVAEKLAASLQGDLADVGVRVHISLMSYAGLATAIGTPEGPPFSIDTWLGDFPDPTTFFDPKVHSRSITGENSTNNSFYANPELDALLDRARAELDPTARAALYRQVERILYDDAPWLWNYHQLTTEIVQPYVRGYAPHPVFGRDYAGAWLDLGPSGERVAQ